MGLIEKLKTHLVNHHPEIFNSPVLLAFSGGRDSVALADLLISNGIIPQLAHFNFQLRGKESDEDEKFSKEFASHRGLHIHVKRFETKKFAEQNKRSIQMAARELRYEALEKMLKENKLKFILTAHHLDDSIETFFINLFKGTGIRGLCGIPEFSGNIRRPLLFANRQEIDQYLSKKNLQYRDDSSNQKTDYLRNKIRLELIPVMENIWPGIDKSFEKLFPNLEMSRDMAGDYAKSYIRKICSKHGNEIHISIELLFKTKYAEGILYEYLHPYGFSASQIRNMIDNPGKNPGKKFIANDHFLLIDRDNYILAKHQDQDQNVYKIGPEEQDFHTSRQHISFRDMSIAEGAGSKKIVTLSRQTEICYLDKEKLEFPLTMRIWKQGDRFIPFGMKHEKKISDFLIDKKVPLHKKELVKVLISGDKIACIPGLQISNLFRVDDTTRNVYLVELNDI